MSVNRRGLEGSRGERAFARYAKGTFSIMPDAVVTALVEKRVGRNGWAVMAALCRTVFDDGGLGRLSSREACLVTGLTPYQVARGMAELREKAVIAPVTVKNSQGYRHPDRSNHGHVARYCIVRDVWAGVNLRDAGEE